MTLSCLNLNADMGESYGAWTMGDDAALLDVVDSANLACGFHAGDPLVMRRTLRAALARGVSIGAHPSYPDLQGFGRRRMQMSPEEIEALVLYQIGALAALAQTEGGQVSHVKPHGALNNAACAERQVADAIVRAMQALNRAQPRALILLAPACSLLYQAGVEAGVPTVAEIFADRAYADDGQLAPRNESGAMLHGAEACLAHVLRMLDAGGLITRSGRVLPAPLQSICVHGDGPEAVAVARALREGLRERGQHMKPLPALLG